MQANSKVLLSIVLVGRNDNYGGDFKSRLQNCITWTHLQLTNFQIYSEIIFVNYNPLPDQPIENFIEWPLKNKFVSIRIVTVDHNTHIDFVKNNKIKNVPVLEYFAKNIGIRRTKGEYILVINPDVLIDPKIFSELHLVSKSYYYRADRIDFSDSWNSDLKPLNIKRVFLKGHSYKMNKIGQLKYLRFKNKIINAWKKNTLKIEQLLNILRITVYEHNIEYSYHCNVSGDFILMHREHWYDLRGFRENPFIALHNDALFIVQAATLGLKEKIYAAPIYHQEHSRRFDANDDDELYRESYLFFQKEGQEMIRQKKTCIYNDENWGVSKKDFTIFEI